jgi:hypothetical protein
MRQKTTTERDKSSVEAAVSAANTQSARPTCSHGTMGRLLQQESRQNGSQSRGYRAGFTLAELVVTVGVLVLLVLLATQLLKSAATVTTLGHKQMDADSQARQLLDRMAIDFAQMVKRSDVDFFAKGTASPNSVGGAMNGTPAVNDQIAFYSVVPGYYPPTGSQSPVSLVGFRVNSGSTSSSYNKLERLGKGLVWNGVSSTDKPVVFMPLTVSATWPAAVSTSAPDPDGNYEVIGPQIFRFEYYYLLNNGSFSVVPWISPHTSVSGMQDVSAIVVDIAVIDPKSKVLLTPAQITSLAGQLTDYSSGRPTGWLRTQWQTTLDGNTTLPRPAVSGIRVYERFIYLSPPIL